MRIPEIALTLEEKLVEFDAWLTPQLVEIKSSGRFRDELSLIAHVIESLAPRLNNFGSIEDCAIHPLATSVIEQALTLAHSAPEDSWRAEKDTSLFICGFFNLLFSVTGATDNNLKNHFMIKLLQDEAITGFPERVFMTKKGVRTVTDFVVRPLGQTIKCVDLATKLGRGLVSHADSESRKIALSKGMDLRGAALQLTYEYISLIMVDRSDFRQFWAVCRSYMRCLEISPEAARALIAPSIIFKIRGSVSASAGHVPETILRDKLQMLGLEPDVDYNLTDVIIGDQEVTEGGKNKTKTRAYDFTLPYKTEGWSPKIFIQSQFYAGDSGSVSHKVVDQTVATRPFTRSKHKDARFVEFLDGAGYFASLRGDLIHMLRMEDTHSVIQVRSLWVRLRRELQSIGFITPIEIEHAALRTDDGNIEEVKSILTDEGYSLLEIERGITYSIGQNILSVFGGCLQLNPDRIALARRLFIIDTIAIIGRHLITAEDMRRSITIPGYGPSYGSDSPSLAKSVEKSFKYGPLNIAEFTSDLEWLTEEKVISQSH
ncbi:hypothetical protein [Pseudomonas sp. PH1b]|uniref:hypothetical protein n=1 Tax=Pseudomonas sp. PH1b TaxID=1397282 RepID=UPI000B185AD5|nr:hypothetical protein [Pseudomonas sp. PH1b]